MTRFVILNEVKNLGTFTLCIQILRDAQDDKIVQQVYHSNHKSYIIHQKNMLIKDYYTIQSVAQQEGKAVFQISLNPQCQVYEGHFPGEPVSPGVCNIQMIKECAEQVAGKSLFLSNLQQCRLTTLVTPLAHPQVEVTIQLEEKGGAYKLKATLGKGEEIYLDLKAELNS